MLLIARQRSHALGTAIVAWCFGLTRWPYLAGVALLTLLAWPCVHAATPTSFEAMARQPYEVYLEVSLNGVRIALISRFRILRGSLYATGRDLNAIGLATDKLGIADAAEVSLDDMAGLRYHYDDAHQVVEINVPDGMRKPYTFDTRQLSKVPTAASGRGLVLNYDAFAQSDSGERLAIWSEQRYFDPAGVFSNTGIAYFYRHDDRYLRFDTSWSSSDPGTLRTMQFGDTISSSLAWSRSIRLAGFQWRSNFALRPDLITFPVPMLSGSAVVPSSVDLYINNVRQFSTDVPSGPFVFNSVPGINGAGQATLITRDALGRSVATSLPLYIDTRLLASGLSSYSFEAGFLRRNYGAASFDYDSRPAGSGSMRYGVNDALTVEGHAEATHGLINAGGGALLRVGAVGVLNGSVAASGGRLTGTQVSLGYQMIHARFSVDAQTTRAFGHYGDLAARDGAPVPTAIDRLTVTLPFFSNQNLALSYIGFKLRGSQASRIGSMSYAVSFGNLLSLNLSAFQDFKKHDSRGIFLGVNIGLGDNTSINTTVGRQNGQSYYNANAIRPPDYGGGWGWGLQAGHAANVNYRQAQLQYLGDAGQLIGVVQDLDGHTTASLDAQGSLVWMDGSVQPARHIYDGFALVSTDGVAGIPVLDENRVIGKTGSGGHLLVPDLNAYQDNRVAIDSMNLPADMHIGTTTLELVPQAQSGVLARFPISREVAASVIVHDAAGKPMAPGTRVHHLESGTDTVTGYDGLVFISGLQAVNHLQIDGEAGHCELSFTYQAPGDHSMPTIGPVTCGASAGHSP
ncbi:fimbria/pilus outer membrane usher protein [Dyella tabacisoli]|uniref:Fimbrial biogenesis outer membrane usher protein n=1 Tax=Dyella tabacisoli TaxID=2282381 RepID=A0A369UJ31_9GAMM|nr:fimbria/pilus outer membrane usher protein [Dyella tabacisoli]RDD80517.1 fimbrial biogenesis outer membrane usher protein [Dyella tabacisoli]